MKAKILDTKGKKKKNIDLPKCFSGYVREDIAQKFNEVSKKQQPYGQSPTAGRLFSNRVKHVRNTFRSHYGRGISRVPRKVFWRRGDQFYWEAAGVPGVKGGRRAHPPKPIKARKKMNKKEIKKAVNSAIAATAIPERVIDRYETIEEIDDLPLIVDSKVLDMDAKQLNSFLKKLLGKNYELAIRNKRDKRAGKGKRRGRKNKRRAGLLLVIGNEERCNHSMIEVKKVEELSIRDLWPLGRLTMYTEKAIENLDNMYKNKQKVKVKK